ncbi:hypothetical protein HMPREF0083_05328 [Aneurinibacillus aneurinilyticus ATCC 12856]|uniref:Uncharacterized protein n=1 Tax=Aneurinibacillus aneurinilyticus ATCC 12856 TaxID=649747 RepID=U1Y6I7_ANEAE|nr:hypothetical protein HMPREF0083_05328 [Aneurinibacillus aneurinilyticus ATCC 12856]
MNCELSGLSAPLAFSQGLWILLIFLALFVALVILRFISLLLTTTQNKGETPMKNNGKKEKMSLLTSSALETKWALGVSYTAGIAMSPIAHN